MSVFKTRDLANISTLAQRSVLTVASLMLAASAFGQNPDQNRDESRDQIRLSCSTQHDLRPLVVNRGQQEIPLVDLQFNFGEARSGHLFCLQWMAKVKNVLGRVPTVSESDLRNLYTGSADRAAMLTGRSRRQIYAMCETLGSCRVGWPYRIGPWLSVKRWFRPQSPYEHFPQCRALTLHHAEQPKKELRLTHFEDHALALVQTPTFSWSHRKSMSDEFNAALKLSSDATYLLSTMSFAPPELARLAPALKSSPRARVFFLYDLVSSTPSEVAQVNELAKAFPRRFFPLPVFVNSTFARYYHIKGFARLGARPLAFFTGANITRPDNDIVDAGFSFTDAAPARGYANLLLNQARAVCAEEKYLQCPLIARFSDSSALAKDLTQSLAKSCRAVATLAPGSTQELDTGPWVDSRQGKLTQTVVELIEGAQRSVEGVTHQFDDATVQAALDSASRRGVKVDVLLGQRATHRNSLPVQIFSLYPPPGFHLVSPPEGSKLLPHAKGLLIDGEKLFWGTGNFTVSGLEQSAEVFTYSRDPKLVTFFKSYLQTFRDDWTDVVFIKAPVAESKGGQKTGQKTGQKIGH